MQNFSYLNLCHSEHLKDLAIHGELKRSMFDDSAATFYDELDNMLGVLGGLLLLALLVVFFFMYDRHWKAENMKLEKATGIMHDAMTFARYLVGSFMPSWTLEKYQFRGMQHKVRGVAIGFEDLSLSLKTGSMKRVLNGVTGEFEQGRMCAIMGPSGAGKTTFMNVLCGKATYGNMGGVIKINGKEANISDIKSVMGFVPQDDIVHEHLTVREQIQFSAQLRNKAGTSHKRIAHITDDVLNVMQVIDIQNNIVGSVEKRGISGGQRKRVNIGLELAAQPTVLFLDEPTSGLDSSSSVAVCASLKKMTQLGMTSVMVIHQPRFSLFTLFDDVLLLGKGGHTVYLGPSTLCKAYFESCGFKMPDNENPADWFMDIIAGELSKDAPAPEGYKPSLLFDLWQARGERHWVGNTPGYCRQPSVAGPQLGQWDDIVVLSGRLDEQWDRIDINKDGVMEPDELKELLARCSQMEPPDEVVEELFQRMAGSGNKTVSKTEFVEYLSSLRGSVAHDRQIQEMEMERAAALHPMGTAGSSSEDPWSISDSSSSEEESEDLEHMELQGRMNTISTLNRALPGFWAQFFILMRRQLVAWWRGGRQRAIFLVALAAGALVLAAQDKLVTHTPAWQVMGVLNNHMALALLIAIFSLNLFGNDQPVFWRESSNGLNITAHFLSRVLSNWVDLFIFTFTYTALYFVIMYTELGYPAFAGVYILITFVASGWGYFVSSIVPPQHGAFIVSLIMFVTCGLLGNPASLPQYFNGSLQYVVNTISLTRWSVDVSFNLFWSISKPIPKGQLGTEMFCLAAGLFDDQNPYTGVIAMATMGFVLHILAFLGIRFMHRDKQV